jgi:hypothetical protein
MRETLRLCVLCVCVLCALDIPLTPQTCRRPTATHRDDGVACDHRWRPSPCVRSRDDSHRHARGRKAPPPGPPRLTAWRGRERGAAASVARPRAWRGRERGAAASVARPFAGLTLARWARVRCAEAQACASSERSRCGAACTANPRGAARGSSGLSAARLESESFELMPLAPPRGHRQRSRADSSGLFPCLEARTERFSRCWIRSQAKWWLVTVSQAAVHRPRPSGQSCPASDESRQSSTPQQPQLTTSGRPVGRAGC